MWIINLICFLIITYLGYKFLYSDGDIVRSPFDKEDWIEIDGPEKFWCLTFATGTLVFSANFGLDLSAIRLGVIELLCIIGLSKAKRNPIWDPPLRIYVVFLLWLLIGCIYAPSVGYGIRTILKYLFPLLLCLFASAIVRNIDVWMKSSLLARTVALASVVFSFVPFIHKMLPGIFSYTPALAINYISMLILSLALFFFTHDKKINLIYVTIFIIPCFVWVLRTSIMGSIVALIAFFIIKYRSRSIPMVLGILTLGVIAVFTIPSLKSKMFKDENQTSISIESFQDGNVTMADVNTNARSAMWEHLERKFYNGNELIGSGTGAVQNYMYNNYLFGGLKVPHSDFVQIKCDNGLIALTLYASAFCLIFLSCFNTYWITDCESIKLAAIVTGASVAGVFVTLYSDNVVNYSMATLSMPFGFYGMMLGLKQSYNQ